MTQWGQGGPNISVVQELHWDEKLCSPLSEKTRYLNEVATETLVLWKLKKTRLATDFSVTSL